MHMLDAGRMVPCPRWCKTEKTAWKINKAKEWLAWGAWMGILCERGDAEALPPAWPPDAGLLGMKALALARGLAFEKQQAGGPSLKKTNNNKKNHLLFAKGEWWF